MSEVCLKHGTIVRLCWSVIMLLTVTGLVMCSGCKGADEAETIFLDTIGVPEASAKERMDTSEANLPESSSVEATETSGAVSDVSVEQSPGASGGEAPVSQTPESQGKIFVYVCGSVSCPGVYELEDGARIFEAVEAAGGMLSTADTSAVNLAAQAADQMQIYIPSLEEAGNRQDDSYIRTGESGSPGYASGGAGDGSAGNGGAKDGSAGNGGDSSAGSRININLASEAELTTLPGIGPSKANDIIEYRETHGTFSSVEELMNIPGIKSGVFEKIRDKITV